ncbi:MAG: hypothetical protein AAFN65_14945 [Bacteroidota bacterium]
MKTLCWFIFLCTSAGCMSCQRGVVKPTDPAASPPGGSDPVYIDPGGTPLPYSDTDKEWDKPTVYQAYKSGQRDLPPLPAASNRCETLAEVRDYTELDGCQQLLETDEGHLLAVQSITGGYELQSGARVRFGFEYVEDAVSICMAEDAIIRVTCVQQVREPSIFPRPIVCESHDRLSEWLYELAQFHAANYITRVPWTDGRTAYFFESSDGQHLYDCQGYLLCKAPRNCLQFIDDLSLGVLIYEN